MILSRPAFRQMMYMMAAFGIVTGQVYALAWTAPATHSPRGASILKIPADVSNRSSDLVDRTLKGDKLEVRPATPSLIHPPAAPSPVTILPIRIGPHQIESKRPLKIGCELPIAKYEKSRELHIGPGRCLTDAGESNRGLG